MGIAANLSKVEMVSGVVATGACAGIMSAKNKEQGVVYESRTANNQNEMALKFSVDDSLTNSYL